MGQLVAVAVNTPRSTPGGARGSLVGALVFTLMAMAAPSTAGVAGANCTPVSDTGAGEHCTSFEVKLDKNTAVSAQGILDGAVTSANRSNAGAAALPSPAPVATASAVGNPVTVAESMVGTDAYGAYGCEDFVDAAYGRTTATGIGHDAALAFYQSLSDSGLAHHEMPIPRGALVFSAGADGDHVDISRGDGTYVSGGVQGLSPGYGDGHEVQILPAPNLGSWTLYGWVYAPW